MKLRQIFEGSFLVFNRGEMVVRIKLESQRLDCGRLAAWPYRVSRSHACALFGMVGFGALNPRPPPSPARYSNFYTPNSTPCHLLWLRQ